MQYLGRNKIAHVAGRLNFANWTPSLFQIMIFKVLLVKELATMVADCNPNIRYHVPKVTNRIALIAPHNINISSIK
jgi:hypothetical protein